MKYVNVIDENVKNELIRNGLKQIQENIDIHGKKIWTFEYDPNLFSCMKFDVLDIEISNNFKMAF